MLLDHPWPWGLAGAFVYGASALAIDLWGDHPTRVNGTKLALAQFGVALFFGPIAAEGFAPTVTSWTKGHASVSAVSLCVGLAANYLWPIFVKALGNRVANQITGAPR